MNAALRLENIIKHVEQNFLTLSEDEWNEKPNPSKWSKKEILGHLIDSEYNNHVRIVKSISAAEPLLVESYLQEEWVKRNTYQQQDINDVFTNWKIHQQSIANLIRNISAKELENVCIINNEANSLKFLIDDYVDHQVHHLKQIFGDKFNSKVKSQNSKITFDF